MSTDGINDGLRPAGLPRPKMAPEWNVEDGQCKEPAVVSKEDMSGTESDMFLADAMGEVDMFGTPSNLSPKHGDFLVAHSTTRG